MCVREGSVYTGPVKQVVFDLAGTTVDFGCMAPVAAFIEGFKKMGVDITDIQAREPMGMEKRAHIRAIAAMDGVDQIWRNIHGQSSTEDDIEAMYQLFVPLLLEVLPDYSDTVPGLAETLAFLDDRQILYSATTGYFRQATDIVLGKAAQHGFHPLATCCATEVPAGRPEPWMIYRCMQDLRTFPIAAVVNVGDTKVDVESGRNAGTWSIGVAGSGNMMGVTLEEFKRMDETQLFERIGNARQALNDAGAHYVIDQISELPEVIEKIEHRLSAGERP